jgi:hypothetical protein
MLRKVDASELIAKAGDTGAAPHKAPPAARILDASKLTELFGIDVKSGEPEFNRKPGASPQPKKKSPAGRKNRGARSGNRSARKNSKN